MRLDRPSHAPTLQGRAPGLFPSGRIWRSRTQHRPTPRMQWQRQEQGPHTAVVSRAAPLIRCTSLENSFRKELRSPAFYLRLPGRRPCSAPGTRPTQRGCSGWGTRRRSGAGFDLYSKPAGFSRRSSTLTIATKPSSVLSNFASIVVLPGSFAWAAVTCAAAVAVRRGGGRPRRSLLRECSSCESASPRAGPGGQCDRGSGWSSPSSNVRAGVGSR